SWSGGLAEPVLHRWRSIGREQPITVIGHEVVQRLSGARERLLSGPQRLCDYRLPARSRCEEQVALQRPARPCGPASVPGWLPRQGRSTCLVWAACVNEQYRLGTAEV